jgi:hypothetical protein
VPHDDISGMDLQRSALEADALAGRCLTRDGEVRMQDRDVARFLSSRFANLGQIDDARHGEDDDAVRPAHRLGE